VKNPAEKMANSTPMFDPKQKEIVEKIKKIIDTLNKKDSQTTLSNLKKNSVFGEKNFVQIETNTIFDESGNYPAENIVKTVESYDLKLTYVIRDIAAPKHNPYDIDLDSVKPNFCLVVYGEANEDDSAHVNLYYNKKIDEYTYCKIESVIDSNFTIVANSIHKHYLRYINGKDSGMDLTMVEHYYDSAKKIHLYTIPIEILFSFEIHSVPHPVCKYYTYFADKIVSSQYEYLNESNIHTCSNPVMKNKQSMAKYEKPCPCPYGSAASQLTCLLYEPSYVFEKSAFSTAQTTNPIVTQVVLRSFKDKNTKEKFYTVICDGLESFNYSCKEDEADDIFHKIVVDLSVEGQSFTYTEGRLEQPEPKKELSFMKNIFDSEKQNVIV
jgi:hypothetical protein